MRLLVVIRLLASVQTGLWFQARGRSARFFENSKIRQDLLTNAGYHFGKLPEPVNPDRFQVRLVDRPAQRIAYVRVVVGYIPDKIMGGFERLMERGREHELVPSAPLVDMSRVDPEITPMKKYPFSWEYEHDSSNGRMPVGHLVDRAPHT